MDIKPNDSKEEVVKNISQYQGLAELRVVAINPTKEEIESTFGYQLNKDPEYTNIELGENNVVNKVSLYLSGINNVLMPNGTVEKVELTGVREEFIISTKEIVSKDGKPLTVNSLGQDQWGTVEQLTADSENPSTNQIRAKILKNFLKFAPFHTAKNGELQLLNLIRNYANLGTEQPCAFDKLGVLMNGDITELSNIIKQCNKLNNTAIFLLGVSEKEGGKSYQAVYNKIHSRPSYKNPEKIFNSVVNEKETEFKANWGNNYTLRLYKAGAIVDTPDTEPSSQQRNPFL